MQGSYFFRQNNGTRHFIRGVYYGDSGRAGDLSTAFLDVLSDDSLCHRDIAGLVALNINTLVVEDIDMTKNHSDCMRRFEAANIAVLLMLNGRTPRNYMRNNQSYVAWDYRLIDYCRKIIDGFSKYPNTLGFFIGVSKRSNKMPQLGKRAIIDLKKYTAQRNSRTIPIGYVNSIQDVSVGTMAEFMNCGSSADSIDFYGWGKPLRKLNFCIDASSIFGNGLAEQYAHYSIPTFTLGGCRRMSNHSFSEIQQIFGDPGQSILSGVAIREWLNNPSNGADLGKYSLSNEISYLRTGGLVDGTVNNSMSHSPDFYALSSQLEKARPSTISLAQYKPTNTAPACHALTMPDVQSPEFDTGGRMPDVVLAANLPTLPYNRTCSCMMNTLECITDPNLGQPAQSEFISDRCKNAGGPGPGCKAIFGNETTGEFGAYMGCDLGEKSSWVANEAYLAANEKGESVCRSVGGIPHTPVASYALASDCQVLLRQAGPSGTGYISITPEPTLTLNPLSTGLSPLARAGIGLAAAVIGLGFVFAVLMLYFRLLRKSRTRMSENLDFEKAELPSTPDSAESAEAAELEGGDAARELAVAPSDFVDELPGTAHEIFEMEGSAVKCDTPAEQPVARSTDSDSEASPASVEDPSDLAISPGDPGVSPSDTLISQPDSTLDASPTYSEGSPTLTNDTTSQLSPKTPRRDDLQRQSRH